MESLVSIPQAVSTVATVCLKKDLVHYAWERFNTASGKYCCNDTSETKQLSTPRSVSIPQAVSTVATKSMIGRRCIERCFNTASGKYCCNLKMKVAAQEAVKVSIPQAVSTVATCTWYWCYSSSISFNTASGKYCCNNYV